MTLTIMPDKLPLLTWFQDSPDTGDPKCICSLCGLVIGEGELPIRIFRPVGRMELRLHIGCAQQVIVEFAPKPVAQYKNHPTFAEGRAAQAGDVRRGANPYRTGADRHAWWAGWDDAWEEARAKA